MTPVGLEPTTYGLTYPLRLSPPLRPYLLQERLGSGLSLCLHPEWSGTRRLVSAPSGIAAGLAQGWEVKPFPDFDGIHAHHC